MKKSERLLQLIVLLRGKRRASTARELAEKMQVSERTIYRDIQSLLLSGVDIVGEAGIGYLLQPGSEIPPLMFNEKELEALVLGIRLVNGWADDELVTAALTAQSKIKAVLPQKTLHEFEHKTTKYLVPNYKRKYRLRYSELLREAIDSQKVVEIHYGDEKENQSTRKINSLGLMFWGEAWTVVAWCQLRNDYRLFRLDRIQSAQLTNDQFETAEDMSFSHYISRFEANISTDFWDT